MFFILKFLFCLERSGANKVDSAKQNLASTFVNAFVNIGFGKDKLIIEPPGRDLYISIAKHTNTYIHSH
jgi:hypothetical protein